MVKIQRVKSDRRLTCKRAVKCVLMVSVLLSLVQIYLINFRDENVQREQSKNSISSKLHIDGKGDSAHQKQTDISNTVSSDELSIPCKYKSLSDLEDYELHPQVSKSKDGNNRRHAYQPPKDGRVTLVCCSTTAGPLSIAVHDNWAPLGAARFLEMVRNKYFSSKVALMRCVHNFICQFGIAGDPKLNKNYKSIPDDPNWLKEGKEFRTNEHGAFRFARGYFAYAGSGKNSRGNQLIVALGDNKALGGGSPWEVPFGEVVGSNSYESLSRISTVYGEKGPTQGLLHKEGSSSHVAEKFPKLDYITSCEVVDSTDMKEI